MEEFKEMLIAFRDQDPNATESKMKSHSLVPQPAGTQM